MAIQPITTALSRAVALQLNQGSTYLGGGLQLTISPSAQASNRVVLPAPEPIGSVATALGLGLGSSRFLTGPQNGAFFNSPGLSVVTGGGSIAGNAAATASTIGRNSNAADATAINIGLANLAVVSRGGRPDLAGQRALARLACPTLLIVGAADLDVLDLNRQALSQMHCEKALETVPRATHLFEEAGALEQVAELARAWFVRHLSAATQPHQHAR